jgi:hypothetical protein
VLRDRVTEDPYDLGHEDLPFVDSRQRGEVRRGARWR